MQSLIQIRPLAKLLGGNMWKISCGKFHLDGITQSNGEYGVRGQKLGKRDKHADYKRLENIDRHFDGTL